MPDPKKRWALWVTMTGLVAGAGIWTTHFVAMLGVHTGLTTGYDLGPTLASFAIAIAGCSTGFAVSSKGFGKGPRWAAPAGGLVVGVSITLMHYIGMTGYRTAGVLVWNPAEVLASVTMGAGFATAALAVGRPGVATGRQLAGALLLMSAIAGMQFMGMAAVSILPDSTIVVAPSSMSTDQMALAAVVGTGLIAFTAMCGVLINSASRKGVLKQLRVAIDAMPEGLAFYDAEDRLVVWNRQYDELCQRCGPLTPGRTYADILKARVENGSYPMAVGFEDQWLQRRLAAHQGAEGSAQHPIADGRWMQIRERRTDDHGIVTVCVDVTDMKRAEAAMAKARDKALAANRIKSEFLANISHEIRTPMNGIMVMNDMLLRTSLDVQQQKFAQIVQSSAESLLTIVNDILDMAKLEAGEFDLEDSEFGLEDLVGEVVALAKPWISKKDLAIAWDLDDGARQWFRGDGARIRQILLNMLSNAVKFTDRGRISVRVRGAAAENARTKLRVEVQDSGIGVTEETKSKLFEAFEQADGSATRRFGGTGLGLAISRQLIGLMGGQIGVLDAPGHGSVFWFELDLEPVSPKPVQEEQHPQTAPRRVG